MSGVMTREDDPISVEYLCLPCLTNLIK